MKNDTFLDRFGVFLEHLKCSIFFLSFLSHKVPFLNTFFIIKIGPALMIAQAKAHVMLLLEHVLVTLDLLGLIVLVRH